MFLKLFGFHLIVYLIKNISFLFLMQEETDKMVATIESMTGDIHSLKNKVRVLTSEVEEEEKKIKQVIVPHQKKSYY